MGHVVKSIVSLDKLHVFGISEDVTSDPIRHAVVSSFINQFARDPKAACKDLVEKSNPKVDTATLASLIFKTPELDKGQIGVLLAGDETLMKHYLDLFYFTNIRIDDALRMFLLSLRLPTDPTACENILRGFAYRHWESNKHRINHDRDLLLDLLLSIIQLNDALYGMYGFALPNLAVTSDVWISSFQGKDPKGLVPLEVLQNIYKGVRAMRLDQALGADEQDKARHIRFIPKLPTNMTFGEWSDSIMLRIDEPDGGFRMKLLGDGLEFEPDVLDFAMKREVGFRVKGTALGIQSILFDRIGPNAYVPPNLTRLMTDPYMPPLVIPAPFLLRELSCGIHFKLPSTRIRD
jgi:hypothetical protein